MQHPAERGRGVQLPVREACLPSLFLLRWQSQSRQRFVRTYGGLHSCDFCLYCFFSWNNRPADQACLILPFSSSAPVFFLNRTGFPFPNLYEKLMFTTRVSLFAVQSSRTLSNCVIPLGYAVQKISVIFILMVPFFFRTVFWIPAVRL